MGPARSRRGGPFNELRRFARRHPHRVRSVGRGTGGRPGCRRVGQPHRFRAASHAPGAALYRLQLRPAGSGRQRRHAAVRGRAGGRRSRSRARRSWRIGVRLRHLLRSGPGVGGSERLPDQGGEAGAVRAAVHHRRQPAASAEGLRAADRAAGRGRTAGRRGRVLHDGGGRRSGRGRCLDATGAVLAGAWKRWPTRWRTTAPSRETPCSASHCRPRA